VNNFPTTRKINLYLLDLLILELKVFYRFLNGELSKPLLSNIRQVYRLARF
jgi:hypothetical protein